MTEKEKEVWRDIFELYKDMPCLLDISNANYLNRDMRNQAMEILLEKYKEVDEDANMSILKKKIENMRTSYRRKLKKVKASVRTGAGTEDIYTPTLWYFELLHFLDEKNEQSRRGVDTLDSSDEEIQQTSSRTPQLPPAKKQRTNIIKQQEKLCETANKLLNSPEEEWEIIGKSIGCQLKDLDKKQQIIAHKLISDTIFYAKLGKLSENSSISFWPTHFSPPPPTPTFPMASSPSTSHQSYSHLLQNIYPHSHTINPILSQQHSFPPRPFNEASNMDLPNQKR